MRNRVLLGGVTMVVGLMASFAWADVYYSGTATFDGTVTTGGTSVPNGNQGNLAAGGRSINNQWTAAPAGPAGVGNPLTVVGVFPIVSATRDPVVGAPTSIGLGPVNSLVAVVAGRGTSIDAAAVGGAAGQLAASFQRGAPSASQPFASGLNDLVIGLYERSSVLAGGLQTVNADTWTNGAAAGNYTDGLVGLYRVSLNPTDTLTGLPVGGFEAAVLPFVNEPALNTARADALAFATIVNQLKVDRLNMAALGLTPDPVSGLARELIDNFAVNPGNPALIKQLESLLINLPQLPVLSDDDDINADLANLVGNFNSIFDALFALAGLSVDRTFALIGSGTGSDLNLIGGVNGDLIESNSGGEAFPGAQFATTTTPEPATIAVWCVVGLVGAAAGTKLKKLKKVA